MVRNPFDGFACQRKTVVVCPIRLYGSEVSGGSGPQMSSIWMTIGVRTRKTG